MRAIKEIETDLRNILYEYLEACNDHATYSFQGAVSEIAWDVEHHIDEDGLYDVPEHEVLISFNNDDDAYEMYVDNNGEDY